MDKSAYFLDALIVCFSLTQLPLPGQAGDIRIHWFVGMAIPKAATTSFLVFFKSSPECACVERLRPPPNFDTKGLRCHFTTHTLWLIGGRCLPTVAANARWAVYPEFCGSVLPEDRHYHGQDVAAVERRS